MITDTAAVAAPPVSGSAAETTVGRRSWVQGLATALIVGGCVLYVLVELHPALILRNTTPTGGDVGAHVWMPAYLRDHLLPHGRITGWSPDWFAGFPALTFYFPAPALAMVGLDLVLPYDVAFKLVMASGLVALPLCAWAFGKLLCMAFPGPAVLAASTLPFLFQTTYTIYGGNIASATAGEYSFSISLALALLFLGVAGRGIETGKHRVLGALLLLATATSHVIPALFALVGLLVLISIRRQFARSLRWCLPVVIVAGAVSAVWSLAFVLRLPYSTDMGYAKLTNYEISLVPHQLLWLVLLALVGAFIGLVRGDRVSIFLTILCVVAGIGFRFDPQGHLWNARILPFWYLGLYLLTGIGLLFVGQTLIGWVRNAQGATARSTGIAMVVALGSIIWVGLPLHALPLGSATSTGTWKWLGYTVQSRSPVSQYAAYDFAGYQVPTDPTRRRYFELISQMKTIGKIFGCGRAMWEDNPAIGSTGTPDSLMLLPYWTGGCIGSMEGLYYESSATTPYTFIDSSELSLAPPNPERGVTYDSGPSQPNVGLGIEHLRMLGVRYFMALTRTVQAKADRNPSLKFLASVGPRLPKAANPHIVGQHWKIYQVLDAPLVTALRNQPVVITGVAPTTKGWLDAAQRWYLSPSQWSVQRVAAGPHAWARVPATATAASTPSVALRSNTVTAITSTDNSVSFDVSRIGVPVLVKISYFPNWSARGAQGPWRVAPNLMIVVPTRHHVTLAYGTTPLDLVGYLLSGAGLIGLIVLGFAPGLGRAANGRRQLRGRRQPNRPLT